MSEEITVSSVVYNMAGDELDRPQYLKTLVIQNLFSESKEYLGETIQRGLINGPAMKLRQFYRWASVPGNYDQVGLPTGTIQNAAPVDLGVVAAAIPREANQSVSVSTANIQRANALYWANRWVRANRPEDFSVNWTYSIDDSGVFITIVFPAGRAEPLTEIVPATSPGYNASSWYVYADYVMTTTTTVPGEAGAPDVVTVTNEARVFIYGVGSGNSDLDDLVSSSSTYGQFFPFIPVRLENQFLSGSYMPAAFAQTKKAYKKALDGAKIDSLVEKIADNASLGDIDHAYVVFGVSLNVLENECRKYLYEFFSDMRYVQSGGLSSTSLSNINQITIRGTTGVSASYNFQIEWRSINEVLGAGLAKAGAKTGEVWFAKLGSPDGHELLRVYKQLSATSYSYLDMAGLVHRNYVYGSKQVETFAFAAIDTSGESGFIVPLHYDTWRRTSLVSTSQMATACVFVVFNCYNIRVQQWWESWWFRIFIVIVIAIVSVLFTGGTGLGLLGAHMALGTSLGFTGLTAAIVGSVVNALAAMVLMSIIQPALEKLGVLGPLISAVLMFAIGQLSSSLLDTGSMAVNWADLLRPENLLNMTQSVMEGITNQINLDSMDLMKQTQITLDNAAANAEKIHQAYVSEFGYGGAVLDPMWLVDPVRDPIPESSAAFLTRTLMTGSEVAEMSRELLYNFPKYSLKLPDAFT